LRRLSKLLKAVHLTVDSFFITIEYVLFSPGRKSAVIIAGLLATASPDVTACEYVKGEYADYLRCAIGEYGVEVVSFTTQSGYNVDCIYQLQDFRAPKLKAITLTHDGTKEDDTCGHVGSYCDNLKQSCDATWKAKQ